MIESQKQCNINDECILGKQQYYLQYTSTFLIFTRKRPFSQKRRGYFRFFISKCFDNEKKQFIAKLVIKRLL